MHSGKSQWLVAFGAGAIFNLANMIMLSAVVVAGLSIGVTLGLGGSLIIGLGLNLILHNTANPLLMFIGSASLLVALVMIAVAYSFLVSGQQDKLVKEGKVKTTGAVPGYSKGMIVSTNAPSSTKGLLLAIIAGALMWIAVPLVNKARSGDLAMGPYALMAVFGAGMFISTFVFDLFLVNLPVAGEPIELTAYFSGTLRKHVIGLAAGFVLATGILAYFIVQAGSPDIAETVVPADDCLCSPAGRRPDRRSLRNTRLERFSRCRTPSARDGLDVRAALRGRPGLDRRRLFLRPRSLARPLHHPHGLHVDELADPVRAQLAAVARPLDAAERQPRVRRHHPVHEHHARLEFVDEPLAVPPRSVVQALAPSPNSRVVRHPDRVVDAVARGTTPPPVRTTPPCTPANPAAPPRAPSAHSNCPADRAAARPSGRRAPMSTDRRTWSSSPSRISGVASGPTCVASSIGSPTRSASIAATNRRSNSSAIRSCDDESLRRDARLPVVDGARLDRRARPRARGRRSA